MQAKIFSCKDYYNITLIETILTHIIGSITQKASHCPETKETFGSKILIPPQVSLLDFQSIIKLPESGMIIQSWGSVDQYSILMRAWRHLSHHSVQERRLRFTSLRNH